MQPSFSIVAIELYERPVRAAPAVSLRRRHRDRGAAGFRPRAHTPRGWRAERRGDRRRRRADDSQMVRQIAAAVECRQHRRPAGSRLTAAAAAYTLAEPSIDRVRPLRRALPRDHRRRSSRRPECADGKLWRGADRPRAARCALPRARCLVCRRDPRQSRRHRRAPDSRSRRVRPRPISAQPGSATGDRRAAHGRHPRPARRRRRSAASERRPAGDAGRGDRRVRQSLFQDQARRQRRGRRLRDCCGSHRSSTGCPGTR